MSNTIALSVPSSVRLATLTSFLGILCPTLHLGALLVLPLSCLSKRNWNSTKEAQPEEDPSVSARLQRLQNNYEDFGMRRTVEGILVVHDHGHPHILMLQIANAFFKL
jgi:hypothetical protein